MRDSERCIATLSGHALGAAGVDMGADLSGPVAAAMEQVIDIVERDFLAPLRPAGRAEATVEFTADGYLRLDAALAAARFPSDAVTAVVRDGTFWLIPLRGPRSGGLLLKQRNPAGDRSVLVSELLRETSLQGVFQAFWDDDHAALRIPVSGDEERER